jgi:hypothetical protein
MKKNDSVSTWIIRLPILSRESRISDGPC